MFAGRRFVAEFPRHIYVISHRGSSSSTSVIVLSSKGSQVVAKDKPVTGDVVSRSILPSWLECDVVPVIDKSSAVSEVKSLRLRKIRPFSATTLSIFHPNPLCVATPSRKNAIIRHLWRLRVNSSYRKHRDTRLVTSGDVILHMLRHTDCVFGNIFTTRKSLVELILGDSSLRSRFGRIQLLDRFLLRYCLRGTSTTCTTSDSIAEVTIPSPSIPSNPRVVIALDNIRYPQNVGSIIRIAIGLNVDGIYYLRGTADPFDWKVTQVTGGLQFKLPYQRGDFKSLRRYCKANNLTPVVGHLEGDDIGSIDISGGLCIILSNESSGPSPEVLKFAKRILLPMHPLVNSLNVSIAGAILVHQLQCRV